MNDREDTPAAKDSVASAPRSWLKSAASVPSPASNSSGMLNAPAAAGDIVTVTVADAPPSAASYVEAAKETTAPPATTSVVSRAVLPEPWASS